MMIIGIIHIILYMQAFFMYIFSALIVHSQTMIKNHYMFGNTSIMVMVGKVILIIDYMLNTSKIVIFLGNHLLYLDIISHGHVTRLLVL